jgi:putative transposase
VDGIREKYGLSERHAYRIVGQHRGTQRYMPTVPADEDALTRAVVALASEYGRYGYRRVTAPLRADGWQVGKDRVQRIWRREGLKVPQKHRPRSRLWLNDGSSKRLRPLHRNHVWSFDFVQAQTHDGRTLHTLTLIDEHSRACLALKVAQVVIGLWQNTYNRIRPHSSLGYRPPTPVSYPDLAFRLPMAATMQ